MKLWAVFFITLCFMSACGDDDSQVGQSCGDPEDVMYCEDEQTIIECTNCKDGSEDLCWRQTGCSTPYQCRYLPVERGQPVKAGCFDPDESLYQQTSSQPYKP